MQVGRKRLEAAYRLCVTIFGYGHVMLRGPDVDPGGMPMHLRKRLW
jgi:hypothetical protein